jgi:2-polyprenyl-3-methyl-5-hydroxy-6-metoxy-1,4-benzoquinol methylase
MKNLESMRPNKEYDKILKQREADGKTFFSKYNKKLVDVDCPACGNQGTETFKKYGFTHKNEYESARMWTELLLKTDLERKVLQHAPRVEKIVGVMKSQGKSGGVALDMGAGSGAFSLSLKNTGFFQDVIALDLSESCVKACTEIGLKASLGTITDVASSSVDLICVNDLIEHLFDPLSFLKECYRVLRSNGFIFIATPNSDGFDFKILKDKTRNITPPEHLTYFIPHSLALILSNAGFDRPALSETPGILDVEMVLKEKLSGHPLRTNNEYIDYLLEKDSDVLHNFQKFLSENMLSSHMLVMAGK